MAKIAEMQDWTITDEIEEMDITGEDTDERVFKIYCAGCQLS